MSRRMTPPPRLALDRERREGRASFAGALAAESDRIVLSPPGSAPAGRRHP